MTVFFLSVLNTKALFRCGQACIGLDKLDKLDKLDEVLAGASFDILMFYNRTGNFFICRSFPGIAMGT